MPLLQTSKTLHGRQIEPLHNQPLSNSCQTEEPLIHVAAAPGVKKVIWSELLGLKEQKGPKY